MSSGATLLSRYLRQRAELGEREVLVPRSLLKALRRTTIPTSVPVLARETPGASAPAPQPSDRAASPPAAPAPAAANEAVPGSLLRLQGGSGRDIVVRGERAGEADVAVIGEVPAPGEWAFAGEAGTLLDSLLTAVGIEPARILRCMIVDRAEAKQLANSSAPPVVPRALVAC